MERPPEYDKYIKSAQWRKISKLIKEKAGNKCAHCGHGSSRLEVHHKTYERFGHEREGDLEALCPKCHEAADKKREVERKARGLVARDKAAYNTYMTKKFGEDYDDEFGEGREEFAEWRDRKNESGE